MRLSALLLAGTALSLGSPAFAADAVAETQGTPPAATEPQQPQTEQTAPPPQGAAPIAAQDQHIVVTARKRQETLKDVPVAATAITGETIERRGFTSVKQVAQLTPSLNINSDGAGRAFISIRGIGTTLIDTVQPGVGIFVDGIYQPNTSYLNNPLTDVERVEVLRGPQGTLYGKNTLGGAINVITRQPTNEFEGKAIASYAGPDDAWTAGASVSGPIVKDVVQARLAFAHQQQDGFIRNRLIDVDQNPLNTDALSGTVKVKPGHDVQLTVNGYYTWVKGGAVPYVFVTGPTDYKDDIFVNSSNYQFFKYRGLNGKLEFPIDSISTKVTLIGSYDRRGVRTDNADPDFTQVDFLRNQSRDNLETYSTELRFDSQWSDHLSTLFGLYYEHEQRDTVGLLVARLAAVGGPPLTQVQGTRDSREGKSYAAFGNIFWKPTNDLEIALGLRLDHERRIANGAVGVAFAPGTLELSQATRPAETAKPELTIESTKLLPKASITKHWNSDLMTYASVARGFRGGGFNPPQVPDNIRTYKGDSDWAYELGAKYTSPDRRVSLAADVFYNDYKDYVGLNSILRTGNSFTTIDLNSGDVKSYGIELEGVFRPTPQWTLSGGGSLMHARLVNTDIYTQTTGRTLASNRLSFQPDWNFSLNSDYVVPVGNGDLTFNANLVGKGSRIPASIRQKVPEVPGQPELRELESYVLTNGSITYRIGNVEIGAFVNNLFNTKYYESYIERTTLILAGLPSSDVGIIGDKRRYGIRTRVRF
ncbi:MAG: TonB-dependent receptor [Sphingomonas sp.]|nr:TonB-dependent receptor [Sphingomonas sp.]